MEGGSEGFFRTQGIEFVTNCVGLLGYSVEDINIVACHLSEGS